MPKLKPRSIPIDAGAVIDFLAFNDSIGQRPSTHPLLPHSRGDTHRRNHDIVTIAIYRATNVPPRQRFKRELGAKAVPKSKASMDYQPTGVAPLVYGAAPGPSRNPPPYTFPATFTVGGKQTEGLFVTITPVKGHLALLHAFFKLKQDVMEWKADIPQMPVDAEKRWAWFVNVSVERSVASCRSWLSVAKIAFLSGLTGGHEG